MGDPSIECECKYCAKKSQREITASMAQSNILRLTPTQSPAPSRIKSARDKGKGRDTTNRLKEARPRDTRVYAAVQKTVVWCALEQPILAGPEPKAPSIDYWPAVIDEVKLKTKPVPRQTSVDIASAPRQASSSAMQLDSITDESEKGPILEQSGEPLPWTIRQSTQYKIYFLAVSHSLTVDDDKVLPYQAYMPTNELIAQLVAFPADRLNFDKDTLSKFSPCPGPVPPAFSEAVPSYAVAVQIAAALSSYWCLTDDYELNPFHCTTTSPLSQIAPPQTLQQVIEAASQHNAQLTRNANTSSYKNVSAINPNMPAAAVQDTAARILGAPPPPDQLSQTRFQGLWWGAERIWTDDFIRLKVPRRTLAPNGANHILPASGPGKEAAQLWHASGRDSTELGAGMRGVFLRLDGLFTVEIPTTTGTKKEARVCGMLYELADEDWDDPDEHQINGTANPGAPSDSQEQPSAGPSINNDSASQHGTPSKNTNAVVADPTNSGPPVKITLPQAPVGYKFRPILAPGYEFVGAMGLISGRYYPNILQHPRMIPVVQAALKEDLEGSNNLWALEGLSGGYFNSVDPHKYKKSRVAMMQDADKDALAQLQTYQQERLAKHVDNVDMNGDEGDSMDIDEIYE
ncbi:hypothetical protein BDZ97DRAFT_1802387 [Flammula alnicola]|nr:hypothetical protein BDZ97DRAFT_1802387 [Flammula alnicola]